MKLGAVIFLALVVYVIAAILLRRLTKWLCRKSIWIHPKCKESLRMHSEQLN